VHRFCAGSELSLQSKEGVLEKGAFVFETGCLKKETGQPEPNPHPWLVRDVACVQETCLREGRAWVALVSVGALACRGLTRGPSSPAAGSA